MKRLFILIAFTAILSKSFGQDIVLVELNDTTKIDGEKIGVAKFRDPGLKIKCSYPIALDYLKKIGLKKGANLIKITKHKYPDGWSSCHRVTADLYKVEAPINYEIDILWTKNRKLEWRDYKMKESPHPKSGLDAFGYTKFSLDIDLGPTIFSKRKFIVKNKFTTTKSWVTKDSSLRTLQLLEHERLHFDIGELYARKLYKELVTKKPLGNKITLEAEKAYQEYEERQRKYDIQTNHGELKEEQQKWQIMIGKELAELETYSKHN